MKLPQLLSHFLYRHKTLSLPGIGIFTLNPSISIPELNEKDQPQILQGAQFEQVNIQKPDTELIDFIHSYTGKMRPLAESDLDSFLRLGIQLLNIGKPFYIDGIGSIIKNKEDKFEFTPGEYSTAKLHLPGEEKAETNKRKKVSDDHDKEYAPQSKTAKNFLLTIGFIGGIVLIAWAGYTLYKKKTVPAGGNESNAVVMKDDTASQVINDSQTAPQPSVIDSLQKKDSTIQIAKKTDSNQYKFVILETSNKNRALRRYDQLLSYQLKVKMDEKDSSFFKIYFTIHASPKDTLRIKDSLNDYYATKTLIELK